MFLFNCNYAILYYNITSYSPRQAHFAPAVVSFYGLAGDSMHNMKFSLDLIPASGPIVSFIFSLLSITNSSKTLPWPISPTTARKPRANASPTKSIQTNPSSPPSKPPATPAPAKSSPQNKSKSSSPSSANLEKKSSTYE